MPHTDTSKSQATNCTSYHASHRCQQITGNKSYILQCFIKIPENSRQPNVHLTMHHTDTSKSPATNRTSCHASHRYLQITGNNSYFLPCFAQVPAIHRQQNRPSYHASHRYKQITGNKSYILPCLTQIPENHRQQIVHPTMPHTDTCKSQATTRASYHASHRYQQFIGNKIVHLTMPHTDTSKSQATNRTSYHASHRYQKITGNKSYILPCLTQIPANHRQQIVHLTMLHTDTRKSQAILPTNRTSCHASR